MKISALVTSLVLGISTVASAAPSTAALHAKPVALRVAPPMHRPAPLRWTVLDTTSSSRFGRQVIDVSSRARYSKLKLELTRGVAVIDKVMITFANGRTQTVDLDKRLGGFAGSSQAVIDLDGHFGRQISKIVIVSKKSNARASYSISAA